MPKSTETQQTEFQLALVPGAVKAATSELKSGDLWNVNIDDIVVIDEFNVRSKDADYDTKVREIADSIKANGYLRNKPVALFVALIDGVSVLALYDGHRRLGGAKLARSEGAELNTITGVTAPKGTSMEDLTVALVVANNGEQLKPGEVAAVCKRLINFGMETPEIAKRLGFTKTYVESLLELAAAPREIRNMVASGKVAATLAIQVMKKHGTEATKVLKDAAVTAEAAGKTRVTKKAVEPKVKAVEVPKRDLLAEGAQWILDKRGTDDFGPEAAMVELLCFLTGSTESEVVEIITPHSDIAE